VNNGLRIPFKMSTSAPPLPAPAPPPLLPLSVGEALAAMADAVRRGAFDEVSR